MEIFNLKTNFCSISIKGKVRLQNEDSCGYASTPNGYVFVVCDGMGGHVGGKIASNIAVKSILNFLNEQKNGNTLLIMKNAIEEANKNIYELSVQDKNLKGMGTTVVLLIIKEQNAFVAHVGDSRIYLHTDGKLHRITKDHSYVQSLVDNGSITEEEAERHPRRNQIMNALGIFEEVKVELAEKPILPKNGDILMLCSDGLNGMIKDLIMETTLNKSISIKAKGNKLVELAMDAGGRDNITVQLIEISNSQNKNTVFESKSYTKNL